jgi:GST-like protein
MLRILAVLDKRLAEVPYLGGEDYSLADVATFPRLKLLHKDLIELDPARHQAIIRWVDAISARPAVRRAMNALQAAIDQDGSAMAKAHPDSFDRLFGRGRYTAPLP